MPSIRSAAFGLALFALAGANAVQAAPAAKAAKSPLQTCLAKPEHAIMQDASCAALLHKANISSGDLHAMKSCMSMGSEAMMKDQSCSAMMKSHGVM